MNVIRGAARSRRSHAVVVQSDELLRLSTVVAARTPTGAAPASFRPEIEIEGTRTRVMVDHVAAVNVSHIGESVRMLSWDEVADVDRALELVLGLAH